MKYGIFDQIDESGRPLDVQYEERLQLVELYDRLGFHCFHQSEHHATSLSMAPSQSVFLAAVAQRSKKLRLCPLVYLLPVHHPLRLVEEICMLDHLSRGRFEFGVGRGASPYEIEALGVSEHDAAEAYAESYDIIKDYFTSSAPTQTHHGKTWSFDNVPRKMQPYQRPHPPMWYVSASPQSAEWPARHGMNLICGGPLDKVRAIRDRYREVALQAGAQGRPDALIGIWRFVVVAETDDAALEIAEKAWPKFQDSFYQLWRAHGSEPRTLKPPPTYAGMIASGHGVAGSPATVAQALIAQARSGAINYLMGHFMFGDMPHVDAVRSIELFASDVMPAMNRASAEWL
jgi:alkanesulfonate monooxygenase SsuD/methylene tetrahydromethanopterin reductase-like flavin-dependent oxidoreductase (luciferase family)